MNLAINYLVRSNGIKKFFKTPCSLFLTNNETGYKSVVVLKEHLNDSEILNVSHWCLFNKKQNSNFPNVEKYKVNKFNVFRDPGVIFFNHSLMEYIEEPIDSSLNSYRGAMNQKKYDFFLNNFLNTDDHKRIKEKWLWKAFNNFYFPKINFNDSKYYFFPISNHQKIIKEKRSTEWKYWLLWKRNLIFKNAVAAELIFNQEYKKNSNSILIFP